MPPTTSTSALPAGTIQIMPRAIERTIASLLTRIPDVVGVAQSGTPIEISQHTDGITISITVQLRYEAPIEATAERAKTLLQRELPRILGTAVSEIRVYIAAMRPELQ